MNIIYKIFLLVALTIPTLYGCSAEKEKGKEIQNHTYYKTKDEAIEGFFKTEGYSKRGLIAIEEHNDTEIMIFTAGGIGFAEVIHAAEGYRLNWDGRLRDFEAESEGINGIESHIEIHSEEKVIPAIIGKIIDKDINQIEITFTSTNKKVAIPLQENQEFWYFFYEGEPNDIDVHYVK